MLQKFIKDQVDFKHKSKTGGEHSKIAVCINIVIIFQQLSKLIETLILMK